MDAADLAEVSGDHVVLMWPDVEYGKRICQGLLGLKRPRPDEWEVFDHLAPHDQIHPKFRAVDVSRVVQINGMTILLMVYPEHFSAAARKYETGRKRQKAKGGPYGAT